VTKVSLENVTPMNIGDLIAFVVFVIVVIMGFAIGFYLLRHKR
jgi:UPF0716 family protein affecting phage T7 exclusion